jgi:DNA-binding transcriptional ArsR family regulator
MTNNATKIVKIAKALSDKNRIEMLKEISAKGTITCSEVEKKTLLSQPTVSHHIKILLEANLITGEKQGKYLLMSLNKDILKEFSPLVFNMITGG